MSLGLRPMTKLLIASLVLGACTTAEEPRPAETQVQFALTPTAGQGIDYQGIDYQGIDYQGNSYQGTSFDGAGYEGGSLADGSLSGTALVGWHALGSGKALKWEQRFPDHMCLWDRSRTTQLSCTYVDLRTQPSPLAGSTWPATFLDNNNLPVQVALRIGTNPPASGAVQADTSHAMHSLSGHATSCGTDYRTSCGNANGCRINCDIWLYDVKVEQANHQPVNLCPEGQLATAVAGTYSETGARTITGDKFTFACTNGTIAKCTRWGYRPFGGARRCNQQGCNLDDPVEPLADSHQACIRAATADYCANGHSFTKNGTLVDIYDYQPHQAGDKGFIPRTVSLAYMQGIPYTAFVHESRFDKYGATEVDYMRYFDLGSLQNPIIGCPGRLRLPVADEDGSLLQPSVRADPAPASPAISIDSTPMCSHSELTIGRSLHLGCSRCTRAMWEHFGPDYQHCMVGFGGNWDQACVDAVTNGVNGVGPCASGDRMTSHSECTAGAQPDLW